jgi:hypothetical protein
MGGVKMAPAVMKDKIEPMKQENNMAAERKPFVIEAPGEEKRDVPSRDENLDTALRVMESKLSRQLMTSLAACVGFALTRAIIIALSASLRWRRLIKLTCCARFIKECTTGWAGSCPDGWERKNSDQSGWRRCTIPLTDHMHHVPPVHHELPHGG